MPGVGCRQHQAANAVSGRPRNTPDHGCIGPGPPVMAWIAPTVVAWALTKSRGAAALQAAWARAVGLGGVVETVVVDRSPAE